MEPATQEIARGEERKSHGGNIDLALAGCSGYQKNWEPGGLWMGAQTKGDFEAKGCPRGIAFAISAPPHRGPQKGAQDARK